METLPDFERLFSQGNGWDHCWCMGYQGGNKSGPRRAEKTVINRADKARLVGAGRSHGILVYAEHDPVGWCQFGPQGELPVLDAGGASELFPDGVRLWRITCFVTHKQWQGKGVAETALGAALTAVSNHGRGLVEGYPYPHANDCPEDPEVASAFAALVRQHGRDSAEVRSASILKKGRVTYSRGKPLLVEEVVEGVGRVNSLCRWWGPAFHVGTVGMFQRHGFKAVGTIEPSTGRRRLAPTGADDGARSGPTRIVMQREI